ncbi:MAG: hypothetical protein UR26_C0003G0013 [candidate division TM6 bacterium GW2011_GWF2_32_72]|nr:MAG: hypothetical protein UR26_C0003G0013 [candidate division TM6 bacterium GW2011_GWF2_32_72]
MKKLIRLFLIPLALLNFQYIVCDALNDLLTKINEISSNITNITNDISDLKSKLPSVDMVRFNLLQGAQTNFTSVQKKYTDTKKSIDDNANLKKQLADLQPSFDEVKGVISSVQTLKNTVCDLPAILIKRLSINPTPSAPVKK